MRVQIRPDLSGSVRVCPDLLIVSPSLSALFQRCLADRQAACKPGSVPDAAERSAHRAAAIHLGRRLPAASCDLPGDGPGRAIVSLFGLAPGGACSAGRSPDRWCALTAPSHPYRRSPLKEVAWSSGLAVCFCALSVSSRCLGVTQRPVPWSPDFPRPPAGSDPSGDRGRPAAWRNSLYRGRRLLWLCVPMLDGRSPAPDLFGGPPPLPAT